MSNTLSVAAVTASLKSLFLKHLPEDVDSPVIVTAEPPNTLDSINNSPNKLNVYLYHIVSNPSYRNLNLPLKNSSGQLMNNPVVGIDVFYLLTAYVKDNKDLLSEKILGSAIRIVNENPILTPEIIDQAVSDFDIRNKNDNTRPDLANQRERIKVTFQSLSIEEITKLWSSFFQSNYRTSISCHVSVILLERRIETVSTIPVHDRLLYVSQLRQPKIKTIDPPIVEWAPDASFVLIGENLKADMVKVTIDNLAIDPSPANISNNSIFVTIPNTMMAGPKKIQVFHPILMGIPKKEHIGNGSNVIPFIFAPKIIDDPPISVKRGSKLTLHFQPPVMSEQSVEVLIGNHPSLQMSLSDSVVITSTEPINSGSVQIPANFPTGKFLLRIRIDSKIESLLEVDKNSNSPTFNTYVGPTIEVTP